MMKLCWFAGAALLCGGCEALWGTYRDPLPDGGPAALALTSAAPTCLATTEEREVTLRGAGFAPGAVVSIGGVPLDAAAVRWVSAAELRVTVPARRGQPAGSLALSVKNPDGQTVGTTLRSYYGALKFAPPVITPGALLKERNHDFRAAALGWLNPNAASPSPDLAVAGSAGVDTLGNLNFLYYQGGGMYKNIRGLALDKQPNAIALGNLFAPSGPKDAVVVYAYTSMVSVFQNNVTVPLSMPPMPANGKSSFQVAIGDLSGDGRDDLLLANQLDKLEFFPGLGGGRFEAGVEYEGLPTELFNPLLIADMDGDQSNDVVTVRYDGPQTSVLVRRNLRAQVGADRASWFPKAAAVQQTAINVGVSSGSTPVVADLNCDSRSDVALAHEAANGVSVLLGKGGGALSALSAQPFPVGTNPKWLAQGDLDGDGRPDLVAPAYLALRAPFTVLRNQLGGCGCEEGVDKFARVLATAPMDMQVAFVGLADLNGDGRLDLVGVNDIDGSVVTMLNQAE